jgi:hypothetical protein
VQEPLVQNLTAVGLLKMPKVWLTAKAADQTKSKVN